MAIETAVTDWASTQFGGQAQEVARRVVRALTDAQQVGARTQDASGLQRRYPYGSTWTSKFEQLVEHLGGLPGAEVVPVPGAPYKLMRVNGRLLIPFVLARSLGDVPARPKLTSELLRTIAERTVPRTPPVPTLFDQDDPPAPHSVPAPRAPQDAAPIVFIGVVGNADSEALLAAWWGTAESIDADGVMTWSPTGLPPQLVSELPRPVATPGRSDTVAAFDEGAVPALSLSARPRPVEVSREHEKPGIDRSRRGGASTDDRE